MSSSRDFKQYTELVCGFPKMSLILLLHSECTVIRGSMVLEWLVLPHHSRVSLFESWPWSSECAIWGFWLILCQFLATLKGALCVMFHVTVKQLPSEIILTMEHGYSCFFQTITSNHPLFSTVLEKWLPFYITMAYIRIPNQVLNAS